MSNYTTQTAALKAVTIDTAKIDAKQIDTKKLFINGELFDPSQISGGGNGTNFSIIPCMYMIILENGNVGEKMKLLSNNEIVEDFTADIGNVSDNYGLPNGVYLILSSNNTLQSLSFHKMYFFTSNSDGNQTIDEVQTFNFGEGDVWYWHLCNFDDDVSEVYNRLLVSDTSMIAIISHEVTTENTTYSLRKPEVTLSLLEKARQIFEERKQQNLDKSAE